MNVAVSFLSSNHSFEDTIKMINDTSALYIHTDIMDGKYVSDNTFDKKKVKCLSKNEKKCDVHLMVENPEKYLKFFKSDVFELIYFHPKTVKNINKFLIKINNKKKGIVINPDDNIFDFIELYDKIDYILVMSVVPGKGGQEFIEKTIDKIDEINCLKKEKNYKFKIAIDGGVNNKTINFLKNKDIDYVVSGSFICKSDNFEKKIKELKEV